MKAGRVTRSAHGLGVVAVDAGDRVLHELDRLAVGHRVDLLEALDDVAVARLLVGEIGRGMAVQAGAGLLHHLLAQRVLLVLEHVGVAALLAEIRGERIALPHGLEADVLVDLRSRHDRARIGLGRRTRHRLAAAVLGPLHVDGLLVELVVQREHLAPDRRVVDVVVDRPGLVLLRRLILARLLRRALGKGIAQGQARGKRQQERAGERDEHRGNYGPCVRERTRAHDPVLLVDGCARWPPAPS